MFGNSLYLVRLLKRRDMKKILLITALLVGTIFVQAQTGWKIKVNSKLLLSASKEDEEKNTKKINAAEWKKNGSLEIVYSESDPKKYKRSILFVDENDNELIRKDNTNHAKISISALKNKFSGKAKIRIFTIAIPADPELAARVRVRRVHLCTLELK
jgi:hypothetical protein